MSVSSRGKRQPFREAFARVKDMRSFLPGVLILALTASVKGKDRSCLWKSCGMKSDYAKRNRTHVAIKKLSLVNTE